MNDNLLIPVIAIAEEAGKIALKYFRQDNSVIMKPDSTPVTRADQEMDELICQRLKSLDNSIPIVSEEMENFSYQQRKQWPTLWVVDPLDGTKHYISGREDYSVNIALVTDGKPVLSVVFAPSMQLCYYAQRGKGAFRRNASGQHVRLRCQQEKSQPLRVAISHGEPGWRMRSYLQSCGDYQLVKLGSSLKQCWVAESKIDVYPRFGKTCEWDTAAAQLVLEEAGGSIISPQGTPLVYNKEELQNPEFIAHVPWYKPATPWYKKC